MPIPFVCIPKQIRNAVVQKLDAHDFGQFKESSKLSYDTARKIRTKLTASTENVVHIDIIDGEIHFRIKFFGWFEGIEWTVRSDLLENTPIRIAGPEINIKGIISQKNCEALAKILRRTLSSFECLRMETIMCTPEAFNNLLLASNCRKLVCEFTIPKEFVKVAAIKNIEEMDIDCFLDDEALFSLKMRKMCLRGTNVTCEGVNLFIHEFFDRKREITEIQILLSAHTIERDILNKGINVGPAKATNDDETKKPNDEAKTKPNIRRMTYHYNDSYIRMHPSVNTN